MTQTRYQERILQHIKDSPATHVLGVDEVGLGAWAGPVAVAAAVFEKGWLDPQVKDSKLLTHNKRVKALEVIYKECVCHCCLFMPSSMIDELGIEGARRHLFEAVILYCRRRVPSSVAVQDGELVEVGGEGNIVALPKADLLVPAVSAASIIAKVSRDLYMKNLAKTFPYYGFETNVGYHSAAHVAGLEKHGPCPEHRRSYRPLRKYC